MALNQWREEPTPTQQRLAREHAERMKRWRDKPPPAPRSPVTAGPVPTDAIGLWLASWRIPVILSAGLIQSVVAGQYSTTRAKLVGSRRFGELTLARHIAIWLSLDMIQGTSLAAVGRSFGDRDHSTVLHARNRIREMMADDPAFAKKVEHLRQLVLKAVEPAQ